MQKENPTPLPAKKTPKFRLRNVVVPTLVLFTAFYLYQPNRFDFIPRQLPALNPPLDPDSARLFAKGTKVAIVTAHPDDAEFFLGGFLTHLRDSGAVITLIVCTDGDKGYYIFEDAEKNRRVRRKEQEDCFDYWHGHKLIFLGYPDGRLHPNADVEADVTAALVDADPEYVFAFDPDYPPRMSHGDHRTAGIVAAKAVKATRAKWLCMFQTAAPNHVFDITKYWDNKTELLTLHGSQFYGTKLNLIEGMLEDMASTAGSSIGVDYGESVRCQKLSGNK